MYEPPSKSFAPAQKGHRSLESEERPKLRTTPPRNEWSSMSIADLVRTRDEITAALPPLSLAKMNLEEEVLLQFHTLRELQGLVMNDDEVPVNQRAQVANSVASTLATLGKQQMELYSSERFKDIENALIRELEKLPEETAQEFLQSYEKILIQYAGK